MQGGIIFVVSPYDNINRPNVIAALRLISYKINPFIYSFSSKILFLKTVGQILGNGDAEMNKTKY